MENSGDYSCLRSDYAIYNGWPFIPSSIISEILSYLKISDINSAMLTCKYWYKICNEDNLLWKCLFHRDFKVNKSVGLKEGTHSYKQEYKRLLYEAPIYKTEVYKHSSAVLHVSFSKDGKYFATCCEGGIVIIWESDWPIKVKYECRDLIWSRALYSEFDETGKFCLANRVLSNYTSRLAIINSKDGSSCPIFGPYISGTFYERKDLLNLEDLSVSIPVPGIFILNHSDGQAGMTKVATKQKFAGFKEESDSRWEITIENGGKTRIWRMDRISYTDVDSSATFDYQNECCKYNYIIFVRAHDPFACVFQFVDSTLAGNKVSESKPNISRTIRLGAKIEGMQLSPDHKYLYVNIRPRRSVYARELEIRVIDMSTLLIMPTVFRSHKMFGATAGISDILTPDVSDNYVTSGSEDKYGYLWDRHYGICVAKYPHAENVGCVGLNPCDGEMAVTVSHDQTITVWRSKRFKKSHLNRAVHYV